MDSQFIEKRQLNQGKSDEEILSLTAPEGQNFVERGAYLLINGKPFQKIYICNNIKLAKGMEYCIHELFDAFKNQLLIEEDNVCREMIKALCELIPLIKLKKEYSLVFSDLAFQLMNSQTNYFQILDQTADLLKILYDLYPFDLQPYQEALFLETDNQMYEILKIIQIFYPCFSQDLQRQAIIQIKSSVKHKDERVRKLTAQVILSEQTILNDIMKEFDWYDKLTNLIYDSNKEVRTASAELFLKIYPRVTQEIQSQRFKMLLCNIIEQMDQTQLQFCTKISQYIIQDEELQQIFVEKIRQLTQSMDSQLLYLEVINNFYQNQKQFSKDNLDNVHNHLLSILTQLSEEQRSLQFLTHLSQLYQLLDLEIHYNILTNLFSNFELNQLQFIPFLEDIILKAIRFNKNKQWLNQLQKIYDIYKRSIFQYETKGLWFEIDHLISILSIISKILLLQKDFIALLSKMTTMGSNHIRKKVAHELIEMIPELESQEYRDQIAQQYLQYINNSNYQNRLLILEFCIAACKKRSRKFFMTNNLINAISLQFDPVYSVRIKLAQLIYEIKVLLWNEEKDILIRVTQVLQMLIQDKKTIVAQISKGLWDKLQALPFHNSECIMQQAQLNSVKENLEQVNLKVMNAQSSARTLGQKHVKTETQSKLRNQTPTSRLPPIGQQQKRNNNFLQVPMMKGPRKSQGKVYSKSPLKFK